MQHEDRGRESLLRVIERLTALERRVDRIADYLNASRGAGDEPAPQPPAAGEKPKGPQPIGVVLDRYLKDLRERML